MLKDANFANVGGPYHLSDFFLFRGFCVVFGRVVIGRVVRAVFVERNKLFGNKETL